MEGQQKMKDKVLHRLLKTLPMLIVLAVLAVAAVWITGLEKAGLRQILAGWSMRRQR